jgi:hypothetical protein
MHATWLSHLILFYCLIFGEQYILLVKFLIICSSWCVVGGALVFLGTFLGLVMRWNHSLLISLKLINVNIPSIAVLKQLGLIHYSPNLNSSDKQKYAYFKRIVIWLVFLKQNKITRSLSIISLTCKWLYIHHVTNPGATYGWDVNDDVVSLYTNPTVDIAQWCQRSNTCLISGYRCTILN